MIADLGVSDETRISPSSIGVNKRPAILTLSRPYWRFLGASVFFDFGFGLYFFLFNLYLAALGFDETRIGFFTSAFTLGSFVATIPAGFIARRCGLRPLLAICMIFAPATGAIRAFTLAPTAQTLVSFVFGVSMCSWAICTPTALARLTTESNRSLGFSLNFGVGIGSGVLAGLIGGNLPVTLTALHVVPSSTSAMRVTLLLACASATLGALSLAQDDFIPGPTCSPRASPQLRPDGRRFLVHFLVAFGMWSFAAAAFAPFANIYMVRRLGIPLPHMGEVFAASQSLQFIAVVSMPFLQRWLPPRQTILAIQFSAGAMLLLLAHATTKDAAIGEFILLNMLIYMAGPTIYALLMTATPDSDRSTASAAQSLTSSFVGIVGAALAGLTALHYGYSVLLSGLALIAIAAALIFWKLDCSARVEHHRE